MQNHIPPFKQQQISFTHSQLYKKHYAEKIRSISLMVLEIICLKEDHYSFALQLYGAI